MSTPSGWGAGPLGPGPDPTPAARGLAWAAPALLRALDAGHPSQRARALRLLGTLDRALLEADPIAAALRRHLAGDDADLARRVGNLVAARGLAAFGPDLVQLLRGPRHDEARRWLRAKSLPRPAAALLTLALDPAVDVRARREALRLLEGEPLSERVRASLVVAFAERDLQGAALDLLRPHATEDLVGAAVVANAAFGAALDRKRRLDEGLPLGRPSLGRQPLEWLLDKVRPARVSPLGVHRDVEPLQRDFLRGIARLAVAARSPRWLARFAAWVDEPSVGPALVDAWLSLEVTDVGEWALGELLLGRTSPARLRLLGALATNPAALTSVETRALPAFGEPADPVGAAAILAAARLRARKGAGAPVAGSLLARLLDGALLGMRKNLLGEAGGPGSPAVGHLTTWAPALGAGVDLQDPRFARLVLDLLAAPRGAPELLEEAMPAALAALARGRTAAAVDVVPALRLGLEKGVPEHAVRWGLEAVRRGRLLALAPAVVNAVRSPARAAAATRAFAALLVEPQDVEAARGPAPPWGKQPLGALALDLVRNGPTTDEPLLPLLARLKGALPAAAWREVAAVVVERATGAKALRLAFAALEEDPEPSRRRALAVRLLASGSGPARTLALEGCLRLGLVADLELALPLARLAADALEQHATAPWARRQVTLLLDALSPRGGAAPRGGGEGLSREAADLLRERFRACHAWSSAASFHALHREALDLLKRGVDLGPLHGGLLLLLSRRTLQHPKTGQRARYEGPLPRFEQTLAASAPVVEGLFDLVASAAYRRTGRALLALLSASRARAREGALGLLDREVALANAEAVLARLDDEAADVRAAAVGLLDRHELARFAPSLRPRLDDADPRVRLAAARTLARFGDRSCVARLVEFLGASDVQLRREAVTHLRGYAPEELAGLLAPLVTLAGPLGAAAALAALPRGLPPGDEPLKDAVLTLAAKGAGPLRAAALRFLPALCEGEQHGARRLAAVVPLLADPTPEVRAAAAHVLRRRDGRKHAPAIAALAVSLPEAGVRAELLGLLADLDVPDAARALLPLLLDPDQRVRAGTRVAARRARGFSLVAELDQVLKKGVAAGALPDALAELVVFLDHVGGEDAAPALADALRCEARPVWEAILAAARARGTDLHGGRLVELLKATRPLAPALVPLAVSEVARLQRREGRPELERVLTGEGASGEVARRAALEGAIALGADAGALARGAEDAAVKRLAAVRGTKAAKHRKTARATLPEQVAARATVAAARRVTIETAATTDALAAALARGDGLWARALGTTPLGEAVGGVAVGTDAAKVDVVPSRSAVASAAFARAAALVKPSSSGPAQGLPRGVAGGLQAVAVPDPRTRLAWRLRDQLAPPSWRAAVLALEPERDSPTAFALELALVVSRNGPGEPGDEGAVRALLAAARRRAAAARTPYAPEVRARWQAEDLVLALAEHALPALTGLVPELIAEAVARVAALQNDWQRAGEAAGALRRWGQAALRLGLPSAHEGLAPLAPLVEGSRHLRVGDDPWGLLLAATGDVPRLAALARPGAGGPWSARVGLLAEAGGPAAAKALLELLATPGEGAAEAPRADEPARAGLEVRLAVASAAALLGAPGSTLADPLLALSLRDATPAVLAAALGAVEALEARAHADAVVRLLGHASAEVQLAACGAARALELDRARDGLLLLVAPPAAAAAVGPSAAPAPAGGHAVVLERAGARLIEVIKRIRELAGVGLADAKRLAETPGSVIAAGLGEHEAGLLAGRLRDVGATVEVRAGAAAAGASGSGLASSHLAEVQGAAVRALLALATPGLAEGPTVDRCLVALRGASPPLAEGLARLLVRACPVARLDEVGALLGEPVLGARLGALRVLGRRGHAPALPVVRALVADEGAPLELRAAACTTLADLEDLASLPAVDALFAGARGGELRVAALEARARLVRRKDGTAAARAVLLAAVADPDHATARAAHRGLATSVPRDGDEVMARRLLRVAGQVLTPGLALEGPGAPHEETPAELLQRAAGSRSALGLQAAEVLDGLARAIVAQADPHTTSRLAALLAGRLTAYRGEAPVAAILGRVAVALPRDVARSLTRVLREPASGHLTHDAWRELLVGHGAVDPAGAAARATAALRDERNPHAARHRADLVRLVAQAHAGEPRAWAPWLRQELASGDATARRAARAALEPGRFPALQGPPAAWRDGAWASEDEP